MCASRCTGTIASMYPSSTVRPVISRTTADGFSPQERGPSMTLRRASKARNFWCSSLSPGSGMTPFGGVRERMPASSNESSSVCTRGHSSGCGAHVVAVAAMKLSCSISFSAQGNRSGSSKLISCSPMCSVSSRTPFSFG